jgi:antitoxin YefM
MNARENVVSDLFGKRRTVRYEQASAQLAELMDWVTETRETVVINRRGHEPVALIAIHELNGLLETVHLLRSRTNANRLFDALERAEARIDPPVDRATILELKERILAEGMARDGDG